MEPPAVPAGASLNPNGRIFGRKPDFGGAFDLNECPSAAEGFGAGECGGGGLGMDVTDLRVAGSSTSSGVGCSALEHEKITYTQLLTGVESGAPAIAVATEMSSCGIPDISMIRTPSPVEKEEGFKKKRQRNVKMKKHRPKIFDDSKPRRIPRPASKRESVKRKYNSENSLGQSPVSAIRSRKLPKPSAFNPQTPKPLAKKKRKGTLKASTHCLESCKRGINFNLEKSVEENENNISIETTGIDMEGNLSSYTHPLSLKLENRSQNIYATKLINADDKGEILVGNNRAIVSPDDIGKQTVYHAKQPGNDILNNLSLNLKPTESSYNCNGGKEMIGMVNQNGCRSTSLQVYCRKLQATDLLRYSRKFGPHCLSIFKGRRTKRQKAPFYNLRFMESNIKKKVVPSGYELRSSFKQCFEFTINRHNLLAVLPIKSQMEAAIDDPESFKCSISLCPIVKSRRKRSKRFPRYCTTHLQVSHSTLVKNSSDSELLCHAEHISHIKEESPCLESTPQENLEIRRSASSHTKEDPSRIEPTLQENLGPIAQGASGLESKFGSETRHVQDGELPDIDCQLKEALTPTVESAFSHTKEDPSRTEPSLQEIIGLIEQSASGLESKFGSENQLLQDGKLCDIQCHLIKAFIPTIKRSDEKVKLKIYSPQIEATFQQGLLPIAQRSQPKFNVNKRRVHRKNVMAGTGSQVESKVSDIESIIQLLERLQINEQYQQIVRHRNLQGAILPYQKKMDPQKKQKVPKVDLDPETIRMWNLLMEKDASELPKDTEEEKRTNWEEQRELFRKRVEVFISCMHVIQGDRRFSPWKGSVVDSVVGVFLTQNVSDYLSSNAFMSLAAEFPPPSRCSDHQGETPCSQSLDLLIPQSPRAFIPSTEDKEIGSMEDGCVVVNVPVGHVASGSSPDKHQIVAHEPSTIEKSNVPKEIPNFKQSDKVEKMLKPDVDWEELRRTYCNLIRTPGINLDAVDWDAVRRAPVEEIAKIIESRGMNNVLAAKIKAFLQRLVHDHGSVDLEWLKDIPPDKAKEFLLSIRGVGLKSTECVRLLTLGHLAFPVDTNIARIAVRLGWVPLEPLPGDLQIHLLEQYPQMDAIQKYLWPRLCTLDKNILYVLHYQLITFGKVICTKKNPNCNACPLRAECRHFASAFASSRLRLRGAGERSVVVSQNEVRDIEDFPYGCGDKGTKCYTQTRATAIEILPPLEAESTGALERATEDFPYTLDEKDMKSYVHNCDEPIIEVPASPEPESTVSLERGIEEIPYESDDDEIPHFRLDTEEFKRNLLNYLNPDDVKEEVSNALVALTPNGATIPAPKIKTVERLRTKHRVYILPDTHPLLNDFPKRECDDPCPYLLAIWPKESSNKSEKESSSQESEMCGGDIDSLGNATQEANDQTVCGTILIPCRTANKGSFPLNGTYFQVNEVFVDHESSECPINVPRKWIWALEQRNLYCGSTASAISRGMDMQEIQHCFWNGFICVRAFNRRTCKPEHLGKRFHELPSVAGKKKILDDE
ncbi:unnamed protein product [Cuscuta campestris]|uniref:HhH-GPD domain-containing protein n=1 Tax=Cuscuta campestris TaxID=132261 RepID=A0A484M1Y3_9ASTE|nr:unnamed protein product [Cuscuta campestris]